MAAAPWAVGSDHPAAWAFAWHNVLLKHPGEVPAGAAGDGGAMGELAPFV